MSDVPHLDLKRQHQALREEILAALTAVVDGTEFVGGPRVAAFERAFADACGTSHCVGVANGTDAIELCLRALGVGPGDEVLVPALTFVATSGAVMRCGARPVLVDVADDTALLAPGEVRRRATPRTKAAILVHLYGLAGDPAPLRSAMEAAGSSAAIVEDCAQSHLASVRGKRTGALSELAAFSFYPTKNLGAIGDGGAVTTSRQDLADAVRMISDHGRPLDAARRGEHVIPGFNSRLDGLQAAVLGLKLKRLPEWNARRQAIAARYDALLANRDDVRRQSVAPGSTHSYYLYPIRHARRDALAAALARRSVQSRAIYPKALHEFEALASTGARRGDFPVSEAWGREVLTLPMFPELTDDEATRVVEALPAALDEARRS